MPRAGKVGLGSAWSGRPASWAASSWPPKARPGGGRSSGRVSPARSLSRVSWGTLQPQPFMPEKPVSRQLGLRPRAWGSKGR